MPATSVLAAEQAEPVEAAEFAALMAAFEPFEPRPHLAVAVSGGSDSMALTWLAADWARARGGQLTALTVDHGLRAESAAEARKVAAWCAARGIGHQTLLWSGPAPTSGVQAAARAARYRLLEEWCRAHAVLHLLVAHQREDQAETFLMRLAQASGGDGLGGMAAIVERDPVRVLRPLLGVPRARLVTMLRAVAQDWIEDPSNRNPAFLRARLRAELDADDTHEGAGRAARLARLAMQFGHARAAAELERAKLLARAVALHPAGFAWVDAALLRAAPPEMGCKALAAVLTTVSGADYPPRSEGLARLLEGLPSSTKGGRTLGGCLVVPRRGRILICREAAAVAPLIAVVPRGRTRWDGRFNLDLDRAAPDAGDLWLGALGADAGKVSAELPKELAAAVPAVARPSLAVLRDHKGVVAAPALGYLAERPQEIRIVAEKLLFRPTRPLTGAGFRIV